MKEKEKPRTDVGVIIGRFQVPTLHEAHVDLIQSVLDRHARVIIFLGISAVKNSKANPLDFKHRKAAIEDKFANAVEVYGLDDKRDDVTWSNNLDTELHKWLNPMQSATLYGGRDSFISHYSGRYATCELEADVVVSATAIRKAIINNHPTSADFRAGLIAATGLKYPTAYQTVDIAIVDNAGSILMVRKPEENKWRFVGGYSDPRSNSLEDDARRETQEETGVEVGDIKYIGSTRIHDWRYRSGPDSIKTAFFLATYQFGAPKGQDDVAEARWLNIELLAKDNIMEEHHVLFDMLLKHITLP